MKRSLTVADALALARSLTSDDLAIAVRMARAVRREAEESRGIVREPVRSPQDGASPEGALTS